MTWFYITGFIFLMGGEINAILEAASERGRPRARAPRVRRRRRPSQRPSAMPPGAAKAPTRRGDAGRRRATARGCLAPIAPYPPAADHPH